MPTAFIEERLSVEVSEGSQGGPGFRTTIFESDAGFEQRNVSWSKSRARYDLSYGIRHEDDFQEVLAMFYICKGRATGFRMRDWGDWRLVDELIGTGGASPQTDWQITKTYTVGALSHVRDIKKPVSPTLEVKVADVVKTLTTHYTINYATGIISFTGGNEPTVGQTVKVSCEFDVPVRFDIDQLEVSWEAHQINASSGIEVVELKDPS
jgi:uncharacterized protein (TIGR02217 family)